MDDNPLPLSLAVAFTNNGAMYQPFCPVGTAGLAEILNVGAIVSTLIVADAVDWRPAPFVADTEIVCTPSESDVVAPDALPDRLLPSTVYEAVAGWDMASVTLMTSFTSEVYQPFDPLVPLGVNVITGPF